MIHVIVFSGILTLTLTLVWLCREISHPISGLSFSILDLNVNFDSWFMKQTHRENVGKMLVNVRFTKC